MGMGALGGFVASRLTALGKSAHGWSRTPREVCGVRMYSGHEGIDAFLGQTDSLAYLLPLTPQQRGILNAPFRRYPGVRR